MKHFTILLVITGIFLFSCDRDEIKQKEKNISNSIEDSIIEKELNTNFIQTYEKLASNCKDSVISIIFPGGLDRGKELIKEIYQIEVNLLKEICGELDQYSEMLFLAVWWTGSESIEYIAISPIQGYVRIYVLHEIRWKGNMELILHWGREYPTGILPLINSNCFKIDEKYKEYKGTKDGEKEDQFSYETTAFWHKIYSNKLRGKYIICKNSSHRLNEKLFNNTWFFSEHKLEIFNPTNEIIFNDSLSYSNDSIFLINSEKKFLILAYSDSILFIKSSIDTSTVCLKKQ